MVTLGSTKFESNNGLLTSFAGTTGMKTGYVCASGLNIVASIERGGRSYIAVVLGGASARERNEMAAEMVVNATGGRMQGTGVSVVALDNQTGQPAFNMRPQICGADSKAFAAEREAAYQRLAALMGEARPGFSRVQGEPGALPALPAAAVLLGRLDETAELRLADRQVGQQEASLVLEKANRIPDLSISVGSQYSAEDR